MTEHDLRIMLDGAYPFVTNAAWQQKYRDIIMTPANGNMTEPARKLLKQLYLWQGQKTIAGQHEYLEDPYGNTRNVVRIAGVSPGIKGVEFGGITGQSESTLSNQRQNVVNACIQWHKEGGIVAATYHAAYPGATQTWDKVQRATTQSEFDQILDPKNSLHTALLNDIDKVASYLKQLRDAGVPVLWRPYHEMNGGWFWWGAKKNFAALWNLMFDRFTETHYLDNLIWVWSPNAKNQWCEDLATHYPGGERVDILAADIYDGQFYEAHYNELMKLGCGKLIAIGENGELPTPDQLVKFKNYSYFLTWGKYLCEKNTDTAIKSTFTSTTVLNQSDLRPPGVGDGLKGQYYSGVNFNELKATQVDPVINFNWGGGRPLASVPTDNFSIKWTGYIVPLYSEEYTFVGGSDDGMIIEIGGFKILERWRNGASSGSGKITLEKGIRYPITVSYYDSTGAATIYLAWSSKSQPSQIVPQSQLFSK